MASLAQKDCFRSEMVLSGSGHKRRRLLGGNHPCARKATADKKYVDEMRHAHYVGGDLRGHVNEFGPYIEPHPPNSQHTLGQTQIRSQSPLYLRSVH